MTIDDILNIPKSDKKYFDRLVWIDNFHPGTMYWEWGVRGLKNGRYFWVKIRCDYEKAKEIASDEGRLVEYLKRVEPRAYKKLFLERNRRRNHIRRWNRWRVKRKS